MIEKLKKLGLTGYEAQAYLALVKLGDAEANEIAMNAKIPMGRIYTVLANLEESRLIRTQETRPRKYVCVEPVASLERLSKNKHEELEQAAAEIDALVNNLASELSRVEAKKSVNGFWTVAIGEESYELVRECVLGAKNELLFFMAPRLTSERIKNDLINQKSSRVLSALDDTLRKGIDVKVLLNREVDFSSIEDFPEIKKLLMHMGNELNCRLAAVLSVTPFDIIDGETVSLKIQNPVNPGELFAVINIRDTKLAQELREKFFTIWDKAEEYPGNI